MRYEYDAFCHLARVKHDVVDGITYWQANSSDAAGHLVNEQCDNGVMTTHVYNPASGTVEEITTSDAHREQCTWTP